MTYDYPCTDSMFSAFTSRPSKGRYVNEAVKPYAQQRGWSREPYRWTG